jgi:hypothetical protein
MAILLSENGIWREMVITGHSVQVGRLQDDVERELVFYQFAAAEIFSIKLAVQEALVNAINHGNRMDPDKRIFIRYRIYSERFDIHIVDEGRGFNPDEVPDTGPFHSRCAFRDMPYITAYPSICPLSLVGLSTLTTMPLIAPSKSTAQISFLLTYSSAEPPLRITRRKTRLPRFSSP